MHRRNSFESKGWKQELPVFLFFVFLFVFIFVSIDNFLITGRITHDSFSDTSFLVGPNNESINVSISPVIEIDEAYHLDKNRIIISDISNEVKYYDGVWSEQILPGEYVRVKFEKELDSDNDITIFPRNVSGDPTIEVYEKDKNEVIAVFDKIISGEYNKIYLGNLKGVQNTFDLLIFGGILQFDQIIDPIESLAVTSCVAAGCSVANYNDNTTSIGVTLAKNAQDQVNIAATSSLGASDTINSVDLHFRWTNFVGLNGDWQITPQSQDGLTDYCVFKSIPQTGLAGDEYVVVDIMTGCVDTKAELDNLRFNIRNADTGGGQTGDVLYVNVTLDYTESVDNPPNWSNMVVNDSTPDIGQTVIHNVTWGDDTSLSYAVLEINSSGVGCDTAENVSSTILSGGSDVADLSWVVGSACEGKTIGWKQYANDSADQWNVTSLGSYTVNSVAPTAELGDNPVDNYNSSLSDVTFDLRCSDNANVDTLVLYGNWSGNWIANQTNSSAINDSFWNVSVSGISEGTYIWGVWCNDSVNNSVFSTSNRTINIDLTPPDGSVNSPLNKSYNTNSITFNLTATDALTGVNLCQYSLDGATNVSLTNSGDDWTDLNSSMTQGGHTVQYYCTDFAGNINGTEQVIFFIDSIEPLINFTTGTPPNGTSVSQNWILANVTVNETNFANITYILYNSTGLINQTTYTTLVTSINWSGLVNDNVEYWYNVSVYDEVGNLNQTELRYITLIQNTPPTVSILYPDSSNYNSDVTQINYTAVDDSAVSSCWYSLDSGATNSSPDVTCSNFTGLSSNEGSNTWRVYANDSTGAEGIGEVTFFKDTIFPQFSSHAKEPAQPNEDQNVQLNVTISEVNIQIVILEFNNGTPVNYTVTTNNSGEFFLTIKSGNYTAHDGINYSWYANDSVGNMNQSVVQSFTISNQVPSVSTPAINDTTPQTNDLISCDGGTFSDSDAEDSESARFFKWFDSDVEISGQTSQTLDLSVAGLDKSDTIICSVKVYDGYDNSSWVNSSNTATIQNSAPVITNPLTSVSWDANGSTFVYNYDATDADGDSVEWFDNVTLFEINGTGYISDTPTEAEAGVYSIKITASDSESNTTSNFTYTINDVTSPNVEFVTFTESNNSQLTRNYIQANVTASDTNGIGLITLYLYNSTDLVQTNTSSTSPLFVNFTGLPDDFYYFNATVNDSFGNLNQTETIVVSTDTGAPTLNYVSPTETSGLIFSRNYIGINVTANDPNLDKIIIRLYNSTNYLINSSLTSSSPNFINFTGLQDGMYFYNATANDSFGNSDSLETRNITLDVTNPSISSLTESPSDPVTYSEGAIYEFNATITDVNLDSVIVEFNGVNYTATNLSGNVYNLTLIDLAAGVYNYSWYANDTSGNANQTSIQTYTINNATGNIVLAINGSAENQSGVYGIQTNASASTTFGTLTLLRNGTDVTSDDNQFVTLAAGSYNYTAISSGDQNHSATSTSLFVSISKASSEVNLSVNNSRTNLTIFQDSTIPINLTIISGDSSANLFLYNNGTLINQGSGSLSNLTTFSSIGLFNITGYYNESENYTASSETWFINVTETPDMINPSISSLTESPSDPVTYSEGAIYEFNATVTDNRNLDTVLIEFNGVNYTATNFLGNVYNLTLIDLSVGTYNYSWYANDTSGNANQTSIQTYTVNQVTPSLGLSFSPSTSETYGTQTNVSGIGCPSQLTCNLYRNGVLVSNYDTQILSPGAYNYTYNTTGNANYTGASNSSNLTISQATGIVFAYVNNSRANLTIEQFTEIYLNATIENGTGNIKLYNNGTLINQGSSPLSNLTNFSIIGFYNITAIYSGNENFTASSETWFVNVTEVDVEAPVISVVYPLNTSYNSMQTQLNYTASDNFGLGSCWYSLNGGETNTSITCGQNVFGLSSSEGSNTWTVYANDARGNENSSSISFFVDSVNPTISYTAGTETSGSNFSRNYIYVDVSANDTNFDTVTIRLYNLTSLLMTNTSSLNSFSVNYTGLSAGIYYFNATVNDSLNNENSTGTRNVNLIKPILNIAKPENKTYISNLNLNLNFTVSGEDFVWYNIDGGSNTTISGNTIFNTTEGLHTLYLFANNSLGITSANISFTINSSKFKVDYGSYSGSSKGSTTNFNISELDSFQNLTNLILENNNFGKIEFSENINLTDDANPEDNELDLDSYTNISDNFIEINSIALPNFNKSATLYFYNLPFSNPRILRGGEICPDDICTMVGYSGGTLVFNVTHFTNYSSEETPVVSTSPGGGSVSSDSVSEGGVFISQCFSNFDCEGDRACYAGRCVKLFDIKILDFDSPVELGDFFNFTYFLKGMAQIDNDVKLDFWIEKGNEKVTSGSDVIYIGNFEEKTEHAKLFLPSHIETGVYEFFIQLTYEDYVVSSHRTVEIEVSDGKAIISGKERKKIFNYLYWILILILIVLLVIIFIQRLRINSIKRKIVLSKLRRWINSIRLKGNIRRIEDEMLDIFKKNKYPKNRFDNEKYALKIKSHKEFSEKEKPKRKPMPMTFEKPKKSKHDLDRILDKMDSREISENKKSKHDLDRVLDKMDRKKINGNKRFKF